MDQVHEYRKNAAECLSMAEKTKSKALREQLLDLAREWLELAAEREKYLDARRAGEATRLH